LKQFFRRALNMFGYRMPMRRAGEERAQDQKIERSLKKIHTVHSVGTLLNVE
jgi:hypothetical protein